MGFMQGKKILVTGMLSNRSIAYGIAKAMRREGAQLAFTYQGEGGEGSGAGAGREFGSDAVFACDVTSDAEIDALFAALRRALGRPGRHRPLDRFRAARGAVRRLLDSVTRDAFRIAHDISSYSFAALAKAGAAA